jgi:putative DNA primase/helicase
MRGCFALASITDVLSQASDKSRFAVINIVDGNAPERFLELKRLVPILMQRDRIARLHARTLQNLPTIIKNVETFATVVAQTIGDQRVGDQIGTLLAGAYSLFSTNEITPEKAAEWVGKFKWESEKQNVDESDEVSVMDRILTEVVQINTNSGLRKRTVAELIQVAGTNVMLRDVDSSLANEELQRVGIRYRTGIVCFANNHKGLCKILSGSAFERNYHKVLMRLHRATSLGGVTFAGRQSRAVAIPWEFFKNKDDPEQTTIQMPDGDIPEHIK